MKDTMFERLVADADGFLEEVYSYDCNPSEEEGMVKDYFDALVWLMNIQAGETEAYKLADILSEKYPYNCKLI